MIGRHRYRLSAAVEVDHGPIASGYAAVIRVNSGSRSDHYLQSPIVHPSGMRLSRSDVRTAVGRRTVRPTNGSPLAAGPLVSPLGLAALLARADRSLAGIVRLFPGVPVTFAAPVQAVAAPSSVSSDPADDRVAGRGAGDEGDERRRDRTASAGESAEP